MPKKILLDVNHRYRGKSVMEHDLFIIDPKFKEIIFTMELNDKDEDSYHSFIDEAITMSEETLKFFCNK
ncbi:MAG: hypothetical protein HUJ98_00095 [Bacteroidaceae bacterium]|nr:hypothetical protein [Bacteroidaceae bacterium]